MKARQILSHTALALLVCATLFSCGGNADLEAPQIEFISQQPLPVEDQICGHTEAFVYHLWQSDPFEIVLKVSDNEALGELKIDIHPNYDCHGHARLSDNTEDWSVLDIRALEGSEQEVSIILQAPANPTAGTYHFSIQAVDAKGNDNPNQVVRSIVLHHGGDEIAPSLSISAPSESSLILNRGDVFNVQGTLSDNLALGSGGNAAVTLSYIRMASGNKFEAEHLDIPSSATDSYPFSMNFEIPQSLVKGEYQFVLEAWDGVNNKAQSYFWSVNLN
jgi:hypothetical protein